jgi:hypothetical protein
MLKAKATDTKTERLVLDAHVKRCEKQQRQLVSQIDGLWASATNVPSTDANTKGKKKARGARQTRGAPRRSSDDGDPVSNLEIVGHSSENLQNNGTENMLDDTLSGRRNAHDTASLESKRKGKLTKVVKRMKEKPPEVVRIFLDAIGHNEKHLAKENEVAGS